MNTLQQTTHSYTGSTPANHTQTTTNGDHCPICGQPIAAIVSRAPGVHEIRPCGHELGPTGYSLATLTTREAALEDDRDRDDDEKRLIADGGRSGYGSEPEHEYPGCGAKYYGEDAARGCCLIVDGGSEQDRPAFIGPNVSWVSCWICGEVLTDLTRVEGIDVSDDDEYLPEMKPICPNHDSSEEQVLIPDGGRESEERQADVLEQLVEQTRIQNALLLEMIQIQAQDNREWDPSDHGLATDVVDSYGDLYGSSIGGWEFDLIAVQVQKMGGER